MNELALFAGAGGGVLASQLLGHRVVCAVEIEPYCREVLLRRQEDKILPPFPVWDDVRTFRGKPWRGIVDIVSAGFPCQPFSAAGKRLGKDDPKNMWPDTIRIICEVRPRYAFLENVPGLIRTDYFGEILGDLAASGFDAMWDVVSAAEAGAPHRRERLWIVADAQRIELWQQPGRELGESGEGETVARNDGSKEPMADARRERLEGQRNGASSEGEEEPLPASCGWWQTEPDVGRVADGVASRVDRLKAIGNGQVPAVARKAWNLLTGEV